jgi:hypothetical protein
MTEQITRGELRTVLTRALEALAPLDGTRTIPAQIYDHPPCFGGRPGTPERRGSTSKPSRNSILATKARLPSSARRAGCSFEPYRVSWTSPSRSIASRHASARSNAWQASTNNSRPAASSIAYSDVMRPQSAKPCLPSVRGGLLPPVRTGLTTFRFVLRILWPKCFTSLFANETAPHLQMEGSSNKSSSPHPVPEQWPREANWFGG